MTEVLLVSYLKSCFMLTYPRSLMSKTLNASKRLKSRLETTKSYFPLSSSLSSTNCFINALSIYSKDKGKWTCCGETFSLLVFFAEIRRGEERDLSR